jgi:hypothetical protein
MFLKSVASVAFLFYFYGARALQTTILKGPIISLLPQIKAHHIVAFALDKPKSFLYRPRVYVLDYSPINQPYIFTLINLLIGFRVPAEIRLREIPNVTINETEKIFDEWEKMTDSSQISYEESLQITKTVSRKIKNKHLKAFINKAYEWDLPMNLYTHNCQHFSAHLSDNTRKSDNAVLPFHTVCKSGLYCNT